MCRLKLSLRGFYMLQLCLSELRRQFPDSVRVQRLSGMMLEASGKLAAVIISNDLSLTSMCAAQVH